MALPVVFGPYRPDGAGVIRKDVVVRGRIELPT